MRKTIRRALAPLSAGTLAVVVAFSALIALQLEPPPSAQTMDSTARPDQDSKPRTLRITRMTPKGTNVPSTRQIVFQFNRPVVPIGRMDRSTAELPIEITPALNCQWRWLNTSALACQLGDGDALTPATLYSVTMRPGIKAEDGATIDGIFRETIETQRPRVNYASFRTWRSPTHPVMRVLFTQKVTAASVKELMYFSTSRNGRGDRVDLVVEPDVDPQYLPRRLPLPGEPALLDTGEPISRMTRDDATDVNGEEARSVWMIQPLKELPLDERMYLRVEPGLVSAEGPLEGDESRVVVQFDTYPEFRFLGVRCVNNSGNSVRADSPGLLSNGKCNPQGGVALSFSAPVISSEVKAHVDIIPDLAGGRTDYDPWANYSDYSYLGQPHRKGRTYEVWLPERLKAAHTYRARTHISQPSPETANLPGPPLIYATLRDEFGRNLEEPFDTTFYTDHRKPNYNLVHNTAVLERDVDSSIPLFVTNLERIDLPFRRLTADGAQSGMSTAIELPEVMDVQFGVPLGVREMLGGKSGAVYGTVQSTPNVRGRYPETFFAQVTPWQVHTKLGHYNSAVWVVDMASGMPVKDAKVSIYIDTLLDLSADRPILDSTTTDAAGLAALKGSRDLDPQLQYIGWRCLELGRRYGDNCQRLFVRVEKDGDMALVPLNGTFEMNSYRASNYTVSSNSRRIHGHIHTWGTTAQGVYRAGETIQYKLYVRAQDNESFVPARSTAYELEIVDPTGKVVETRKNLELSEFGALSGEYTVPKSGAVGWYSFRLRPSYANFTWQPMRVLVSDFTPVPFKVRTSLNGDLFGPGDEVDVETTARLHSGGPYTDAEARITGTLTPRTFRSSHPVATSFSFGYEGNTRPRRVSQVSEPVDDKGNHRHLFLLPDDGSGGITYGTLSVESAVRDDRGKLVASGARAIYAGVDRFVGLKNTSWIYHEDEEAEIRFIVVDARGAPAADTDVNIKIERKETKASRVKGAGNAYLTQFVDEWVDAGSCEETSGRSPGTCEFMPEKPGSYRMTASIEDTQGRTHSTQIGAWVAGKGRVVWRQPNDDSLEIIPEKTEYNIGDTARYLVKNPYPGATALIGIERYGVLKQWTQTLEGSTPVIEFPVEKDYMPGYYLSIVVFSPRVEAPLPEFGEVDLGKPAQKMGYVAVPVRDPYKQIEVSVHTAAEVYKPRNKVKISLHAAPRHNDRDEPIEIAVAVLDEAVLDLVQGGTKYYDPYEGFYSVDGLDLRNYSLLSQLVGRQNIEKKGANPGGDGGTALSIRSIFKYVSYWNPSLKTDKNGNAEFEFELPDNLTGWRVLAMAVTPTDRMGLGEGRFRVNRPTEVRPVMPNQVTEGDSFRAGFSVMNRTDKPRDIRVRITAEGTLKGTVAHEETVSLEPYKRATVNVPVNTGRVQVDRNISQGEIRFTVTASDSVDGDGLEHALPVHKRRSLETAANYATFTGDMAVESLKFPKEIYPDVGDISVVLSPTVIGNVDGAFRYMRDYPYVCWEQRLSKGTMASSYTNLRDYLPKDLIWPGAAELPEQMLAQAANFQAPSGGMTYYLPYDKYVSPYLSAYTALAFNWLRDRGHKIPEAVEKKLHAYLEDLLKRDTMPSFYSRGMSSTVRAVALAALAPHGKVDLRDLQRYRSHVEYMSLFGKAHYLQAATDVEGASSIALEVTEMILSQSIQSGGKFSFNEQLDDGYARILATPLRANCAILSAVSRASRKSIDPEVVGDMPFKLLRTISQTRGSRDHWENTQENMFCMNAMIEYSRAFESVAPDMTVNVSLDDESFGQAEFHALRDEAVTLATPIEEDDPGRSAKVKIEKDGQGRLYYAARMSFALKDEYSERVNAGVDIRREYSVERDDKWILLRNRDEVRQGELIRVDIYVSLPTARNFLVVDDPVPGGLEPVNRDLANTSTVDADKGAFQAAGGSYWLNYSDWHSYGASRWSFYHKELRHDAVRFYSDYLPAGNYHLSYTAQVIAGGEFAAMPVHAEEMYDPDVFGKGLPGTLKVE